MENFVCEPELDPSIKKVVVILVNYNGKSYLKDCLSSICDTDYPNFNVIVVDNASKDGSAEFIQEKFPNITLIKNKKNRGLGAGINLGVKYAFELSASYIIFINTDTGVDRRWIREAVKVVEDNPLIGILSFTEFGQVTNTTYRGFLEAQHKFSKIEVSYPENGPGTSPFFMIRTRVFKELGLFDEKYFAYGDDNDFEWRVIRAGFKLAKINIPCFHHGMGAFSRYPLLASRLVMRNVLRLYFVHSSPKQTYRVMKGIFNNACNPLIKYDEKNFQFRRFRPSNIFVNFLLFIYGISWNIYNFHDTLTTKRNTTLAVNLVKEKLGKNV